MPKKKRGIDKKFTVKAPSGMTREQIIKEVVKKINFETYTRMIEDVARRETDRIIWETGTIMVSTTFGVLLGVLTSISAEFFMKERFDFGFLCLVTAFVLIPCLFGVWRHYLLRKSTDKVLEIMSEVVKSFPSEIDLTTEESKQN